MTVLVIGHTRGIGQQLLKVFDADQDAIGCSRATGHDITRSSDRRKVLELARGFDTIILNAFSDEVKDAQHDMLCELYNAFENKLKTIVVISSNSADTWKKKLRKYPSYKMQIDHTCRQLAHLNAPCRVINIRPGYTATDRIPKEKHVSAMSPNSLAIAIRRIIELPSDIRPTEVTLQPETHHGRDNN